MGKAMTTEDTFVMEHEPFCRGLGLDDEGMVLLQKAWAEILSRSPDDSKKLTFDHVKKIVKKHGDKENISVAAFALLKSFHGDKLIYLLIGSMIPALKKA